MAQPHQAQGAGDPAPKTVNRNFSLPVELAEWLRATSYYENTPQAALVREAIDKLKTERARAARRKRGSASGPVTPGTA